jgi:hypothetical protein
MAEVERCRLLMSCQMGPFIDMIACGSHVCGSAEVLKMLLKLIPPDILELICSPAILSNPRSVVVATTSCKVEDESAYKS